MNNKNIFKNLSVFTLFYRYLFSKKANAIIKRVSLICFFGLMFSVGSLLIVFNVMGGLGKSIKDQFLANEPHVIIFFEEAYSASFIKKQKNKIINILKSSHLKEGVNSFEFFENTEIIIRTLTGEFLGAVASGYNSKYLNTFFTKAQNTDLILNKKNIIMGLGLASELNVYEAETVHLIPAENILLPLGEPIYFESVEINSILPIQNTVKNSHYIFYNQKDFPSFRNNSSYVFGFELRLKDPEQFLIYKTILKKAGFVVESWSERNSSVFFALKLEKLIMSIFLSLAGLITLLAVSSLLILLMVQKKQDIGILITMGLPFIKTQNLFVGIGVLLCLLGILAAGVFSIFISLILKYVPLPFLSNFFLEDSFPVEINFMFMLYVFLSVFCLSLITCILSVRSQFKDSPTDLLKTTRN